MNLRELVEDAAHQVNMYKHPDLDEARTQLENILQAAGMGSIAHDHIERIEIDDENVNIDTSWSVRCCTNTSTYTFPTYILDAKNPMDEAKLWSIRQELEKANESVASAKSDLLRSETWLEQTLAKLQEHTLKIKGV